MSLAKSAVWKAVKKDVAASGAANLRAKVPVRTGHLQRSITATDYGIHIAAKYASIVNDKHHYVEKALDKPFIKKVAIKTLKANKQALIRAFRREYGL